MSRLFITLGVVVYALVVPYLEVNASHVFNDSWPPHARLHEVWQLITNAGIGVLALWLVWIKNEVRIASLLNITVMGGVLAAHLLADGYGGSIQSGNLARTLMGMDLAVFAALVVVVLAAVAFFVGNKPLEAQR